MDVRHAVITQGEVDWLLKGDVTIGQLTVKTVPFPKDPEIRCALVNFMRELSVAIANRAELLPMGRALKLRLTARVMSWLVTTGRASVSGIADASTEIDDLMGATVRNPSWILHSPVSAELRRYRQWLGRAKCKAEKLGPPPERWRSDEFSLIELRTREHLITEGARAQNCLGHTYDSFTQGTTRTLRYLRRIESGRYRLFMLCMGGRPVATMEYGTRLGYISEFALTHNQGLKESTVLPAIFGIFAEMGLPLHYVCKIVERQFSRTVPVGTTQHRSRPPTLAVLAPSISEAVFDAVVSAPWAIADITFLSAAQIARLPPELACHLTSRGTVWPSWVTRVAGSIQFPNITEGNFDVLQYCGNDLVLPKLEHSCFPRLHAVHGDLKVPLMSMERFPRLSVVVGVISSLDRRRWKLDRLPAERNPQGLGEGKP